MLGSKLKQAREARQLTLQEVEWATKIRGEYLQALEDEQFDRMPSTTHARGFLRSYAGYLGLEADALVAEYNSSTAATEIVSTRPAVQSRQRDFTLTPGMIVGAALIVLIGIFGLYLKTQFDKYQASRAADTRPTPQLHLSELPTPSPSASAAPSSSPSPSASTSGLLVMVRVDTRTWLQVDVDGKPSADTGNGGRVFPAGTALTFNGAQEVRVISGNPGNTVVSVNGRDQGPMPAANKKYTRT
ncbi:MAG: helix-turn-helix domain-containing protein [Candidatus Dormibacteria bacterium]